jgi:Na+/H+-dicarboxylate symporter
MPGTYRGLAYTTVINHSIGPAPWRAAAQPCILVGTVVGFAFPKFGASLKVFGNIFLSLIKVGMASLMSSWHRLRRGHQKRWAGWRAIIYFELVFTNSVVTMVIAEWAGEFDCRQLRRYRIQSDSTHHWHNRRYETGS